MANLARNAGSAERAAERTAESVEVARSQMGLSQSRGQPIHRLFPMVPYMVPQEK